MFWKRLDWLILVAAACSAFLGMESQFLKDMELVMDEATLRVRFLAIIMSQLTFANLLFVYSIVDRIARHLLGKSLPD